MSHVPFAQTTFRFQGVRAACESGMAAASAVDSKACHPSPFPAFARHFIAKGQAA